MPRLVKAGKSRARVMKGRYGLMLQDQFPVTASSATLANSARLCHDYYVGFIICVNTVQHKDVDLLTGSCNQR